jgi:hypothetical protein
VAEFRDLYMELVDHMEVGARPGTITMTQLHPKTGEEGAVSDLFPRVSRAAGKASTAAGDQSRRIAVTQFGQTRVFDPIPAWQHSLDDPQTLPVKMVLDCCEAIIGSLEAKASDAAAIEGTLAGRVAAFVGFPARVRAAVAVEHPELGKFAYGAGVAGQVVAGVLAGVIVAALVAGVGVIWQLTF